VLHLPAKFVFSRLTVLKSSSEGVLLGFFGGGRGDLMLNYDAMPCADLILFSNLNDGLRRCQALAAFWGSGTFSFFFNVVGMSRARLPLLIHIFTTS